MGKEKKDQNVGKWENQASMLSLSVTTKDPGPAGQRNSELGKLHEGLFEYQRSRVAKRDKGGER